MKIKSNKIKFCISILFVSLCWLYFDSFNKISANYTYTEKAKLIHPVKVKDNDYANFDIILKSKYNHELLKEAINVNTPGNENFKHYLNVNQIGQKYGQSQKTLNDWKQYLAKYHLKTSYFKNNMDIKVRGKVKNINHLFNTDLNKATYHKNPT